MHALWAQLIPVSQVWAHALIAQLARVLSPLLTRASIPVSQLACSRVSASHRPPLYSTINMCTVLCLRGFHPHLQCEAVNLRPCDCEHSIPQTIRRSPGKTPSYWRSQYLGVLFKTGVSFGRRRLTPHLRQPSWQKGAVWASTHGTAHKGGERLEQQSLDLDRLE